MNTFNLLLIVFTLIFLTLQLPQSTLSLENGEQNSAVALSLENEVQGTKIDIIDENQKQITPNENLDDDLLFIALISGPHRSQQRQRLRNTWLSAPFENKPKGAENGNGNYMFYIGETDNLTLRVEVEKEAKEFGDIVFLPMRDAYRNLTLKTRLVFEHASSHYNFTFLGKVDDDVYLCKESVEDFLSTFDRNVSLYFGIMVEPEVIREKGHKWYVSYEEYPHPKYPLYAVGPYYFMTKDLATFLGAERPVPTLSMEDAAVGISLNNRGIPIVRASWLDPWGIKNEEDAIAGGCLKDDGLKIFGTHGEMFWEKWKVCCDKKNPPENWIRTDFFGKN